MKLNRLILTCLLICVPAWGSANQALEEIELLIRLRDYASAASRLIPLAERGDPEAQYRLAGLYRAGKGVDRDLDEATRLYHESAEAGHAGAQYSIALIIEKSNDSPTGRNEARRWYRKSAAQGNERALVKLEHGEQPVDVRVRSLSRADIFDAIRHNDEAFINSLISRGVDLDLTDRQGNSTVMAAIFAGWPGLASTLIYSTRNIEQENAFGDRPLHLATARGYLSVVTALVEKDVDVNSTNSRGDTALMLAVKNGKIDIAEFLLEHGADPDLINEKQKSAVDLAFSGDDVASANLFARFGIEAPTVVEARPAHDLDTFKTLLRKHGRRYVDWPLLNVAIELEETQVMQQILAHGPDLDSTDPDGNRALHIAARKGDLDILKRLLRGGAKVNAVNDRNETALFLAVESGCLDCVQQLLAHQADPSIATRLEMTPLEAAIRNDHAKIAFALLKFKTGYPGIHRVLMLAIQKRMDNLSTVLVARDSQLDQLDDKQRSVLWHSANQGLAKTTAMLIGSRKVDLNAVDVNGHSALSRAVVNGHFRIARLLIDQGADLTALTGEGNTILMLAVLSKKSGLIEYLLTRAIDVNARDEVGDTALMMAAATGQDRVIEMLLQAGADPQLRNKEDLNAYQMATNAGHSGTARLIRDKSNIVFKIFN